MQPASPPVGETFQRWSQDLLAVLSSEPAQEVCRDLERLLVERFEQQVGELADQLRQELPAWQEAAQHLEQLANSRLLPLPEAAEAVRQRACQLGSLLAALEGKTRRPPPGPNPVVEDTPPPEPRPVAATDPVAGSAPAGKRAACRYESAPVAATGPVAGSAPAGKRAACRYESESLLVVCPECGAEGKVRWDRLGHILACRGCKRHFRVDGGGRLTEVIRQSDGRWLVRSRETPAVRAGRYRLSLALSVATLLVFLLVGLGWRQRQAQARVPELPAGLQERAELLARAWLQRDVPLMRRLTVTTHDRVLYSWFVRHQPPDSGTGPPEVKVLPHQKGLTPVEVRVPGDSGGRQAVTLRLFWERRGDSWYFVPPAR
jgi:hypothetical protein